MEQYWNRWELWMREHAPKMLSILNPGVSLNDIAELESATGVLLPNSFKHFYSVHDGQMVSKAGLVNGDKLLSVQDILDEWTTWQELLDNGAFLHNGDRLLSEPDSGIKDDWWNPRWIPFTYDGLGNHLCLDFDPAPGGRAGQVITLWHDDAHREMIAPSFDIWLSNYLDALDRGEYIYAKRWGIVRKDSRYHFKD
ncbi:SMI1/KNR4 family protein [Chitinophaga sp. sic0106]|uniref:SMI1/KNR4 family protein n=1 Tax=Chitinophaga sp. sic0106 TaxID=2854785 RepID=UPI001C495A51|nr:SMI1/KNR4 family protein [Chitinophaga sp. sic0106]MBV7533473.1 SMI1/KNR4 family protein [Chitinophaga sp. sic0106]